MPVYSDGREVARAAADDASLVSRSRSVTARSPAAFLAEADPPHVVWTAPDALTVVAAGAAATVTASGPDRFGRARSAAGDVFAEADVDHRGPPSARPRFLGGAAFHPDHAAVPPWTGFGTTEFVLPRYQLSLTGDDATLTHTAYGPDVDPRHVEQTLDDTAAAVRASPDPPRQDPPGIRTVHRVPDRESWRSGVRTALDRIGNGDLDKVVLAQSLRADLHEPVHAPSILARLGDRHPDCYRFLYAPGPDAAFLGATPERLVSLRGRTVETDALAGSVGRGDTPAEDEDLARSLATNPKDAHEHALVVDTLREQLAPLATAVTADDRGVRRLDTVQHLETTIRARLDDDRHVLSLVDRLHPTPAVGGLPPDAARRAILDAESFDRGWYAGPIGWFDARGNGEFAVGIRSAVAADRSATLFAGAGIVADSDPDTEWEEVQLKYRPVLDALEG